MSEFDYQNSNSATPEGEYHYNYTGFNAPMNNGQPPKKNKGKKKFGAGSLIAVAVCSALLCGIVSSTGVFYLMKNSSVAAGTASQNELLSSSDTTGTSSGAFVNQTTNITVSETVSSIAEAVSKKCTNSVVGIRVTATATSTSIFGQQSQSQSTSEGSGVVYSADGYIITNYHVISTAVETVAYGSIASGASIDVYLASDPETAINAQVIGYDASADLAVLKIDKSGLPMVEIGDSDALVVGQTTIAIGSPGGLDYMGSVSQGIVSGLNRSITTESGDQMNLIQTDAAINPGNSGGALFDQNGKLIGINNAKMSGTDYDGIGFAIPVNEVVDICNRLIKQENTPQAYLGVTINTYYTSERIQMMGYPAGIVVYSVAEGSPAADAGIQQNDIITAFNGAAVTTYAGMISEKNKYSTGDTITLTIYRGRQTYDVKVTLE